MVHEDAPGSRSEVVDPLPLIVIETCAMRPPPLPALPAATFYAAYFGVLGVVMPFLGPYLDHRGLSAAGIGMVTAAFSLSKVIYAPILGGIIDRGLWFRGVLTCHVLVSVAGAALSRWVHGPAALGFAFVVAGLGFGAVLPLVEAAILDRLPRVGYGALRLWGSVGFVCAGLATARLVRAGTGTFPWLLAAAMVVLAATCAPFERHARPRPSVRGGRLPAAVWGLLVLLTVHQLSHGPYYAFFSVHLEAHRFGSSAIAALWSVAVVAELLAFLAGRSLENIGLRPLLACALLLSPLRWLLLALPVSLPVLVVAQCGHAVTFALVHLAGIQLVQRAVPASSQRFAQAVYSGLTFGLGIVAGTALAGPVYAMVGGRGAFLVAGAVAGMVAAAWLPVSRWLERTRAG
jgi:PPP family 3-phenylpropionic acid transporter